MGVLKSVIRIFFKDPFGYEAKTCLLCGIQSGCEHVCTTCQNNMSGNIISQCSLCGRYIPEPVSHDYLCGECSDERPLFYLARSAGPYGGLLKDALYAYKYQRKRPLAFYFADQMSGIFLKERSFWDTELFIPVPLSQNKLRQRGFNQSLLLAEELGEFLKIKVADVLTREQDTQKQSRLNRRERIRNMRDIFTVKGSVRGRKIILIDDILTTGATAGECTGVLLRAGAAKVGVLTVASGIRQKNELK